jgi:hypothetical protein
MRLAVNTNDLADNGFVDHFKEIEQEKYQPRPSILDHSLTKSHTQSMGPEDKNNCAYKIILMFGIGFLLPWQCMLSSLDYLMIEVRDLS